MKPETQTIEITDFTGRLTRTKNGKMDSGYAKFSSSFGYDPFTKPGQLTWLESAVDITGGIVTDLILCAKPRVEGGVTFIYAVGHTGRLYKIQPNSNGNPNLDSVTLLTTIAAGTPTFNYGASIEFYIGQDATQKIWVSHDKGLNYMNFDGTAENNLSTNANVTQNVFHPIIVFQGNLYYGNKNNLGKINSTGLNVAPVVSSHYEILLTSLPTETYITDLDVAPDGDYMFITSSQTPNENIMTVASDIQAAAASTGVVYKWNGQLDQTTGTQGLITAFTNIPSNQVTAMQTFLNTNSFFANDIFGASLNDGSSKVLTLSNNKSPFTNATLANANFLSWINPELDGTGIKGSMYYYGHLDEVSPKGLWRVLRYTSSLSGGFIYQTPFNLLVNDKYTTVNTGITAVNTVGYGKHYFSAYDINASHSASDVFAFRRFLMTPSGTGTPQLGVFETQNQLFSKRISVGEIRVYTEPTVTGNGFQLDIIGSDGNVVTNGSFTYNFAAGTDITVLQGALERINFSPSTKDLYAIGIRITNTGTTNMVINKIELDWSYSGK